MVLKNLNDVSIYIVPLLDDNLTWNDLTVESGYINAYTTDKNRPFNTKESLDRYRKFKQLDSLYNTKYITINNKHYTIYCLSNPKYKKDIHNLQSTGKTYNVSAALEINRFWANVPVPELAQRLFLNTYRFGESINAELPEEDYYSYEERDELS